MQYDKTFKEEAVRLSDEIGPKKAAEQLGIPYHTLSYWRQAEKHGFQKKQRNNGSANWKKRSKTPLPNRKGRYTLVVRYVMNLFQLYSAPAAIP